MMPTQTHAGALRAELAEALEAAGVSAVVTLDPLEAAPALDSGAVVAVVISPPTLEFVTWHLTRADWPVWVIGAPPTDHLAAWAALDQALPVLVDVLEAETAEPSAFTDAQGHSYPAYIVRTTTDHQE